MSGAEISLVLPNMAPLLSQEINKNLLPESLQKLLSKAQFSQDRAELLRLLMNLFSDQPIEGTDLPVLDVWDLNQGRVRADPCYLHADRDKLVLFSEDLNLSEQESDLLIEEIQTLLTDLGITLCKQRSDSWYIETERTEDASFTALPDVKGKNIDAFLPEGEQRKFWIKLWNEVQMLLHSSAINQQRVANNKLPINSIWFWGQGQFNIKAKAFDKVFGSQDILEQLAAKSACHYQSDESLTESAIEQDQSSLYLIDALDFDQDLQQQLQQLEQDYFKALLHALEKKQLSKISLYIPELGHYQVEAKPRWKLW